MLNKLMIQKWLIILIVVFVIDLAFNKSIAQVSPLCVPQTPTEAVKNGGFEDGLGAPATFGQHSLFIGGPGQYSGSGQYYIGKSPKYFNVGFPNDFLPHTGDNMLMVDAAIVANAVCWQQIVDIIPNRLYFFSAWIRSLSTGERCKLQFQISSDNGATWTALGPAQLAPLPDEPWLQVYETWHSGSQTTALIRLSNFNPSGFGGSGNDFAIDDISFKDQCLDPTLGVKPTFPADISLCGKPSIDIPTNIPGQSDIKFTWYKDGVPINNSNTPTLSGVTELGTYTVCVDSNTCLQSNTINVISTLSINLGPNASLCNPATKILNTGIDPTNSAALDIKWFKDGVHQPAYDGMVSITVDAPGTYRVDAVDNRPGGCSATDDIVISSNLPIPNHVEFCGPNQSVTLSVTGTSTYRWYSTPLGGLNLNTGNSYTITPPINGVTYYVVDASNPTCQRVAVSAKVAPTCCYAITGSNLTPSTTSAVCAGTPFNISYSGGQLGDSLMLQKTNDPIAGTWTNIKSVKLSDPVSFNSLSILETTTYRVITFSKGAWGSAACQNSSSELTVNLAVSPISGTVSIDQTAICEGENFTLTLTGSTGSVQWQRSVNGGAFTNIGTTGTSLTDNPTVNQSPVKYQVVVTNGSCPSVTSNQVIGDVDKAIKGTSLTPSVTGAVCAGNNFDITYSGGQSGDSLMLQSRVGAAAWTNVQAVKLSDPYKFTGISINSNTDFRIVTYSNGAFASARCTDISSIITVTVAVSPIAGTATVDQTAICEGESFTLALTGSTGTVQWQRSVNGGTYTNIGTTGTSLIDNPTVNQSPVKYQAVVTNGACPSVTSNQVGGDVDKAIKGTSLTPSVTGAVCAGTAFDITYSNGQSGDSLMLQSKVGAAAWTNVQAVKLSDPYKFTGISITATTDFRVVTYSNGAFATARCSDISSVITVNVAVSPVAGTASISPGTICIGGKVTLTLIGYTGTIQWQRAYGSATFEDLSGATTFNYDDNPNQTPVHYRAIVAGLPCPNVISNTVNATVSEVVAGTITGTSKTCDAQFVNLSVNGFKGTVQWQDSSTGIWTNIPGQTTSTINYQPTDTVSTNYIRVLVSDPGGTCNPVNSTKFIVVSDTCASIYPIYLSNALTANGDGSNDVFYIGNIEAYPNNHLTIFNRWGSIVYEEYGYKNTWDGKGLPVATYYYVLDLDKDINGNWNSKNSYKGTVTLIR